MFDIVAISIVVGLCLIGLYTLKSKKIPETATALAMLLYGQSLVYGTVFVFNGIIGSSFFVDNRWVLAFGGIALFWIGLTSIFHSLYPKSS